MTNPLPDWAMLAAKTVVHQYHDPARTVSLLDLVLDALLSAYQQGKQDGRREMKERAAMCAETCHLVVPLMPGTPDGAAIASRQIAESIRRLDEVQDA